MIHVLPPTAPIFSINSIITTYLRRHIHSLRMQQFYHSLVIARHYQMINLQKEAYWSLPPVKINSETLCSICKKDLDPVNFVKLGGNAGLAHILCAQEKPKEV